jgi:hypothetical protein
MATVPTHNPPRQCCTGSHYSEASPFRGVRARRTQVPDHWPAFKRSCTDVKASQQKPRGNAICINCDWHTLTGDNIKMGIGCEDVKRIEPAHDQPQWWSLCQKGTDGCGRMVGNPASYSAGLAWKCRPGNRSSFVITGMVPNIIQQPLPSASFRVHHSLITLRSRDSSVGAVTVQLLLYRLNYLLRAIGLWQITARRVLGSGI